MSVDKKKALLAAFKKKNKVLSENEVSDVTLGCVDYSDIPLSPAQQGLKFIQEIDDSSCRYHVSHVIKLNGSISYSSLNQAFQAVLTNYPVLRSVFAKGSGNSISYGDVTNFSLEMLKCDEHDSLLALVDEYCQRDMPLDSGCLARLGVIALSESEHVLMLVVHHIVCDGISIGLILESLNQAYQQIEQGRESDLVPEQLSYADYAAWRQALTCSGQVQTQLDYWKAQFAHCENLQLPADRSRREISPMACAQRVSVTLPASIFKALKKISLEKRTSLFVQLLAVYQLVLWKLSGQTQFVVGTPVTNRPDTRLTNTVGYFVNMLGMVAKVDKDESFSVFAERLQAQFLDALEHQDVSFHQIVDHIKPERELGVSPIYQTTFSYADVVQPLSDKDEHRFINCKVGPLERGKAIAQVDLALACHASEQGVILDFTYNSELFSSTRIEQFAELFSNIVTRITELENVYIRDACQLAESIWQKQLGWNQNLNSYDVNKLATLAEVFSQVAARHPNAVAVSDKSGHWHYSDLEAKASQLARHLDVLGVTQGCSVAIGLPRAKEWVLAMLAINKVGATYVPLDIDAPSERILNILDDAAISAVIGVDETLERLPSGHYLPFFEVDLDDTDIWQQDDSPFFCSGHPMQSAYVIYTSGSTGKPKGVEVTNRAIIELVSEPYYLPQDTSLHTAQAANPAFDAMTFEVWAPILNGGQVTIIDKSTLLNLPELDKTLAESKVNTLFITTAMFNQISQLQPTILQRLDHVLFGGEAVDKQWVNKLLRQRAEHPELGPKRLLHVYGPTETTTFSSWCELTEQADIIPIGRGLAGNNLYVLDEDMQPLPVGAVGELYIGGNCVANGYTNRPELTAEKFVCDPFTNEQAGARLYRTGDLVRWLPNGQLDYVSRTDSQIKLRGHRIELGEIENALRNLSGVSGVYLRVFKTEQQTQLAAYITYEGSDAGPSAKAIKEQLQLKLPAYMLPSAYCIVEQFPLNSNGKVDHRRLPEITEAHYPQASDYEPPQGEVENILAVAWQALLRVAQVGRDDNFFDLGGDSLLAIQLKAKLHEQGYTFELQDLFKYQSLKALSSVLKKLQDHDCVRTAAFALLSTQHAKMASQLDNIEDAYPLSYLQRSMLLFNQSNESWYHDIVSYLVPLPFDSNAMQRSLFALVAQHPILRTIFDLTGKYIADAEQPLQLVQRNYQPEIHYLDWRTHLDQQQRLEQWIEEERFNPFPMTSTYYRVYVHHMSADSFQYTLSFNHALLDGWSESLLATQWLSFYQQAMAQQALTLETIPLAYSDFIALEQQALNSQQSVEYWQRHLRDAQILSLESDEAELTEHKDVGHIGIEFTHDLKGLAAQYQVPLKSLLLAIHYRALVLFSGQSTVTSGIVYNGRPEQAGGAQCAGLFLNTLPLCVSFQSGSWQDWVAHCYDLEQLQLPHRRFPLPKLLNLVGKRSLFDIVFNFTHFHAYKSAGSDAEALLLTRTGYAESNDGLSVDFQVQADGMVAGLLSYHRSKFSDDRMSALERCYQAVVTAMVNDPSARHENLAIPSALCAEKYLQQLKHATPPAMSILTPFNQQVTQAPHAVALYDNEISLTYHQLDKLTDVIANRIYTHFDGQPSPVAVLAKPSAGLWVVALAIFKAGGIFTPLDPTQPTQRLRSLASHWPLVISDENTQNQLPTESCWDLRSLLELAYLDDVGKLCAVHPEQAAYQIFTSGTTGTPKGVLISHKALANHCQAFSQAVSLDAKDIVAQFNNPIFDIALEEVFPSWCVGARVCVFPRDQREPHLFTKWLIDNQVTLANLPTAYWQMWQKHLDNSVQFKHLRAVIAGGEAVNSQALNEWLAKVPNVAWYNGYGPTETTITSSLWQCFSTNDNTNNSSRVPIGHAFRGVQYHILNEQLLPVPFGVEGQLYISGDGLALGYANSPDKTAESFLPHANGQRIYKTGDLVRLNKMAELEYVGRIDQQVKIRGYRIELEEIEGLMQADQYVAQAVAKYWPDSKLLVAYFVVKGSHSDADVDALTHQIKTQLQQYLPEYAVPDHFICLASLPMTSSGKVDKKALPAVSFTNRTGSLPKLPSEQVLAQVLCDVLKKDSVYLEDHFFKLGGDSIVALQVISKLAKVGWRLSAGDLFATPIVKDLAHKLLPITGGLETVSVARGEVPLAPIQHWYFEQVAPLTQTYNQVVLLKPAQTVLSVEQIEQALASVLSNFDTLKLRFSRSSTGWTQRYELDAPSYEFVHITAHELPISMKEREFTAHCDSLHQSIQIDQGALFKVLYFEAGDFTRLLFSVHHLVSDAVSLATIQADFIAACQQLLTGKDIDIQRPSMSYQTHVQQLVDGMRNWSDAELNAKRIFWQQHALAGRQHCTRMLKTELATQEPAFANAIINVPSIEQLLSDTRFSAEHHLVATLVSAYTRAFQGKGLYLQLESHGRHVLQRADSHLDFSRVLGWFTNVYSVYLEKASTYSLTCEKVQSTLNGIEDHGLSYGILRQWHGETLLQVEPQVLFNYLGNTVSAKKEESLWVPSFEDTGASTSLDAQISLPLEINAVIVDGQAQISLVSKAEYFSQSALDTLCTFWQELLVEPSQVIQSDVENLVTYPLTSAQQGMLLQAQLGGDEALYASQNYFHCTSDLDLEQVRNVWQSILDEFAVLRTGIIIDANTPKQFIRPNATLPWTLHDFSALSWDEAYQRCTQIQQQDLCQHFDLYADVLMRVIAIKLPQGQSRMIWTIHHIIDDATSSSMLMSAFLKRLDDSSAPLPASRAFEDYVYWLEQVDVEESRQFWRERFSHLDEPLLLAEQFPPKELSLGKAHSVTSYRLDSSSSIQLYALAKQHGVTINQLLEAAWAATLARVFSRQSVSFGVVLAGRPTELAGADTMIGCCVTTVPEVVSVNVLATIPELAKQLQAVHAELSHAATLPMAEIHAQANLGLETQTLFDSLFVTQNYNVAEVTNETQGNSPELTIIPGSANLHFPLSLNVTLEEELVFNAYVRTSVVDETKISLLIERYLGVLSMLAAQPASPIKTYSVLLDSDLSVLSQLPHATPTLISKPSSVLARVSHFAQVTPLQRAIIGEDASFDYQQLDAISSQLAGQLHRSGIVAGQRIGLYSAPESSLIIGALACWKLGCAYVPLDPQYPLSRLSYVAEDAKLAGIILASSLLPEHDDLSQLPTWTLTDISHLSEAMDFTPMLDSAAPSEAYVIYTSGSTGQPKGVSVTHANLSYLLEAAKHDFDFNASDVWSWFHSFAFDFSVWEIFAPFYFGASVAVVPRRVAKEPEQFASFIVRNRITVLNQTPSAFLLLEPYLLQHGVSELALKYVIFGGEALNIESIRGALTHLNRTTFVNMYGITETTVHVTFREISLADCDSKASWIGRPLAHLELYVLDEYLNRCPVGTCGELYVSGEGVANGYVARPALTAERFVPNPFSKSPSSRLYRSGDLGRVSETGDIEHLGRSDDQVKIRGHRIEIGEITTALNALAGLLRGVVTVERDAQFGDRLVAFYESEQYEAEQLAAALSQKLPAHMLPSRWIATNEWPITVNGKLDIRKMFASAQKVHGEIDESKLSSLEKVVVASWQDALGMGELLSSSNFFSSGGDSMRIIRVKAHLNQQGFDFKLDKFLGAPTVAGMAKILTPYIQRTEVKPFALLLDREIEVMQTDASLEDAYPMSYLQQGMLYQSNLRPSEPIYHDVLGHLVNLPLDIEVFASAFVQLIEKHEILRTAFVFDDVAGDIQRPLQIVKKAEFVELDYCIHDWRMFASDEQASMHQQWVTQESHRDFDLTKPLWRVFVQCLSKDQFRVVLSFHHAVLDGWSFSSLMLEWLALYQAGLAGKQTQITPLQSHYRDFIALEQKALHDKETQQYWQHWLAEFEYRPLFAGLKERSDSVTAASSNEGVQHETFNVPYALGQLAKQHGLPLKALLLAAHLKVIGRFNGGQYASTGLVSHSRPSQQDGDKLLGLFLNTVPFAARLDTSLEWHQLCHLVANELTELQAFQAYPSQQIMADNGNLPLYDNLFNYTQFHNYDSVSDSDKHVLAFDYGYAETSVPFAVDFTPTNDGQIAGLLACHSAHYDNAQVQQIKRLYEQTLMHLVENFDGSHQLLSLNTNVEQPKCISKRTLIEAFAEQVTLYPNKIALVQNSDEQVVSYTYQQLDEISSALADRLPSAYAEQPIALAMSRSPNWVIAALAIVKAGFSYLPLDLRETTQRLGEILASSKSAYVITDQDKFDELNVAAYSFEQLFKLPSIRINQQLVLQPNQLAYVIFTSGSTGQPKGVAVEHNAIVSLVKDQSYMRFTAEDCWLQAASLSFDAATLEIWGALLNGGRCVMAPTEGLSSAQLSVLVEQFGVTSCFFTTAWFNTLIDTDIECFAGIAQVAFGGERISNGHVDRLRARFPELSLIHCYGPTENTTFSTCYRISHACSFDYPIGSAIRGCSAYILDEQGGQCPVGVAGELYLGGEGLARGYLNTPLISAERFVPNAFSNNPGERIYKTGDKVLRDAEGHIHFIERLDHQVKIRGYRVELGEISRCILAHEGVKQLHLSQRRGEAGIELIAYWRANKDLDSAALRHFVAHQLPHYMVPAHWCRVLDLPLNKNGKVDEKQLPLQFDSINGGVHAALQTDMEKQVASWWQALLSYEVNDREANFFEVGGNSLLANRLIAKVRSELAVEVYIAELFEQPKLNAFAQLLEQKKTQKDLAALVAGSVSEQLLEEEI